MYKTNIYDQLSGIKLRMSKQMKQELVWIMILSVVVA